MKKDEVGDTYGKWNKAGLERQKAYTRSHVTCKTAKHTDAEGGAGGSEARGRHGMPSSEYKISGRRIMVFLPFSSLLHSTINIITEHCTSQNCYQWTFNVFTTEMLSIRDDVSKSSLIQLFHTVFLSHNTILYVINVCIINCQPHKKKKATRYYTCDFVIL